MVTLSGILLAEVSLCRIFLNIALWFVQCSDNSTGKPDAILIATGSEVELAEKAAKILRDEGKGIRVVSFVAWELFEEQSEEYKESVLPSDVTARVSIEAATSFGWAKYVGPKGKSISVDIFGASAPADVLYEKYGFGLDNVVATIKSVL